MARSDATTVARYLDGLPAERRAVVRAVRDAVRRNLPAGYEECMRWGMISYEVPLSRYPVTYNKQPLGYVALAAQKHYYALYLTCVDENSAQERELRDAYARAGKKLDMGKSCLRFKRLDDLELHAVERAVASTTPDELIARYEASRAS
jgi:uncharacterized protein YdhG (YjbR/CyaY superfamily)